MKKEDDGFCSLKQYSRNLSWCSSRNLPNDDDDSFDDYVGWLDYDYDDDDLC